MKSTNSNVIGQSISSTQLKFLLPHLAKAFVLLHTQPRVCSETDKTLSEP